MYPSNTCQSCRRPPGEGLLSYRKGHDVVRNDAMLQCDVCERYACAECLQVYDIFSGTTSCATSARADSARCSPAARPLTSCNSGGTCPVSPHVCAKWRRGLLGTSADTQP